MRKVAMGIAMVMAAATPVSAQHVYRASDQRVVAQDANDVENKLDLARVAFVGHHDGTATLKLATFEPWDCAYVSRALVPDGGAASLRWEVDTNDDAYVERVATVECEGDRWHVTWGKRKLAATKPNGRTLAVRLDLARMRLNRNRHLSFAAVTFANGVIDDEVFVEETDTAPKLVPYSAR